MNQENIKISHFGAITQLDMPIKKVNLLIGDQGTGKSTVAKLLAIFKDTRFLINPDIHYFEQFKLQNYFFKNTRIEFTSKEYSCKIIGKKIEIIYSQKLNKIHASMLRESRFYANQDSKNYDNLTDLLRQFQKISGIYSYFPAERMFLSSINDNIFGLINSNVSIPKYLLEFAQRYNNDRKSLKKLQIKELNIDFIHDDNKDFLILNENKRISLEESASGVQSIIPLLIVLERETASEAYHGLFLIEEPELNLFPKTQYNLIKHIVERCKKVNDNVLFTTHSPYVLSTINNLIFANLAGMKSPVLSSKIIPKKYWLNSTEVSAYMLNEKGIAEDLIDYELGQIKIEKIDEISGKINEEYDKLNDIYWAKK